MAENNKAVDFMDPEALEAELAAIETPKEAKKEKKAKAPKKPRVITITVPEGLVEGDTFEYEIPRATKGVVAGIPVPDMTEDQLKIEYRNANSVHYKQTKSKGVANDSAILRLQTVVDEMEKRGIAPGTRAAATPVDANAIAALIKAGKVSVDDIQALLDAEEVK